MAARYPHISCFFAPQHPLALPMLQGYDAIRRRDVLASESVDRSAKDSMQQMRPLHKVSKPRIRLPSAQLKSAIVGGDWAVTLEDSVTSQAVEAVPQKDLSWQTINSRQRPLPSEAAHHVFTMPSHLRRDPFVAFAVS